MNSRIGSLKKAEAGIDPDKNKLSKADYVYQKVRADILACRIKPDSKINLGDLVDKHGVSLGAVREALSRLTSEGLVIAKTQRGFHAAPVSTEELMDITATRIDIESLCIQRSIQNGDLHWESSVMSAWHVLSNTPERTSSDEALLSQDWVAAHERFHSSLVSACGSQWLLRLRAMLYHQSERYRHISVPLGREKRDVHTEHKKLYEAVIARDTAAALECLSVHLGRTTEILLQSEINP